MYTDMHLAYMHEEINLPYMHVNMHILHVCADMYTQSILMTNMIMIMATYSHVGDELSEHEGDGAAHVSTSNCNVMIVVRVSASSFS